MILMADKVKFDAIILQHQDMNAAYVDFPFSTEELFGKKGAGKDKSAFDDTVEYRGSLANEIFLPHAGTNTGSTEKFE
jgi:hypothetical protein